ncbi:hypothetical protein F2Q69_00053474 [Brassica cretica]|uniref:Uncharacterized protein n=1 Tax=Brassica cretica TaxID=69181 RepID=A0A8S9N243_BRACR|nr:hypothetical protein F2Q69_00053474 [Brassica cretica]
MIQESLQYAAVELSTRQNTRYRSKLTLQHRSTVSIRYRPTETKKNWSTVVQKNGRTTTTIPSWQHTTCIRRNRLLHHSSWKKKSPSIDRNGSTSIDTQPHQPSHLQASIDIAYYPSIDINVEATRDRDYSIGSWADDHHHKSYAVETAYHDHGADELPEGFTYEELLNVQR